MATLVPPPAYRGSKHDQHDLNTMNDDSPLVRKIWDHLALFGPMGRSDLEYASPIAGTAAAWREYERYHPEVTVKDAGRLQSLAESWFTGHIIDRCLRRGWMVEVDGVLSIGSPPPEHKPLSTLGGVEGAKARLDRENLERVREILVNKTDEVRRKPSDDLGREALKQSIERFGLMSNIVIWEGNALAGFPEMVVDGATRMEIMADLGLDVPAERIEYLPSAMAPSEVLLRRIDFELARKTLAPQDRDEYIVALRELGFKQEEIAAKVGISRQRVAQILAAVADANPLAFATPVAEWVLLSERGWSLRDIANEYGIHHSKVDRALKAHQEAEIEAGDATAIDLDVAVRRKLERTEVQDKVDKQPPSTRQKTLEGKVNGATVVALIEAAIAESGGGAVTKVKDIAGNKPSLRASVYYGPSRDVVIKALRDQGYTVTAPLGQR